MRLFLANLLLAACCLSGHLFAGTSRAEDFPTHGPTDAATRAAAWRQHQEMAKTSIFKDIEWRCVGPRQQGGRIECIACPPGNTGTIYVGAGAGNLWKSINNGLTWKPIFDNESTFTTGDVAIAPSDPNIVWLGTGEVLMARSSYAGTGVFKSTDAGETWENMGLEESHHIAKVVIDPENPNIVYVAAIGHLYTFNEQRGVFKTTDGGKTWKKVLYIDDQTGATDIAMDPSAPNTLYATMWHRDRKAWGHVAYGETSGLFKSTDAGETWQRLGEGLPQGRHVGRIGVAVAPSNPAVVYAVLDCRDDGEGVYRSNDKGQTWKKVNEKPISIGYDFCMVCVSPDNEDTVYVPGQRSFVSNDGGKTYEQLKGTLVHLLDHGSKVLHLDAHAFWIDPQNPDRILLGNDGGFHMSYDRGGSWLHLNTIPIGEFYAVSYDMATPYNIYGGTQDNAALYGPSDCVPRDGDEDPWNNVYLDPWGGGDSYFTLVDPNDTKTIYYEHQFGHILRKNMETGKAKNIQPRAAKGEPPLRYNWMTPFLISRYDSSTLYYGTNILLKSMNRGDEWTPISEDLSTRPGPERQGNVPYGTITTISESPIMQGMLYVGTDDGNVHLTLDDGKNWTQIDGPLPDKWVSRVVASTHDKATVYVAMTGYRDDDFSAYLYTSVDHGRTWTSISANLPGESINVIHEDPRCEGTLYVGTDLGVYVSTDGGGHWHSLRANLPSTPVYDLFIHPRDGDLVIGTHGRSIFVLDTNSIRARCLAK